MAPATSPLAPNRIRLLAAIAARLSELEMPFARLKVAMEEPFHDSGKG